MRRIMKWLGIHEERMAMDAVYAARHGDSFVADIVANVKEQEVEEEEDMLAHVNTLTAFWTDTSGNVKSSEPVLVQEFDERLESLLQEEEWLEWCYRGGHRALKGDPYLHTHKWVTLVGHNHTKMHSRDFTSGVGSPNPPGLWYIHEYVGYFQGEAYYILGNGDEFRVAPISATRP